MSNTLNIKHVWFLASYVMQVEVSSGQSLIEFKPQMDDIVKCPAVGIILTSLAPSDSGFDFYSRYFCPKEGINEVSELRFKL